MNFRALATAFTCVMAVAAAASAAEWEKTRQRGIITYVLKGDKGDIHLLCDTEGAWEPPIFSITPNAHGRSIPEGPITFKKGQQSFRATYTDTVNVPDGTWNEIIDLLFAPGNLEVTFKGGNFTIPVNSSPGKVCYR